jgi:hypothetical protein
MTTTKPHGRLGNQIFRNLAVSLIAEKHDLYVYMYANHELIANLGIPLFCGTQKHMNTIALTDDNYFLIYNSTNLSANLNSDFHFFQTKTISRTLYNYLQSEQIKTLIMKKNPFNARYNQNNDLYIHIRLTDVAELNPGLDYYLKAIQSIQFEKLYISSDDTAHKIVQEILKHYPTTEIIHEAEIKTIQFASTCKNIILSHGSFSAIIGYLAYFSVINYPEYEKDKIWYGDMFSNDGWNKISK